MGCVSTTEDDLRIAVPSHAYTHYRPDSKEESEFRMPLYDDDGQASIFETILPHFDHVHEGAEKEKLFYDLLGNKMGELYTETLSKIQDKMIKGEMTTDDLKVSFSKIILLNLLNMINKLQSRANWKSQRIKFFLQVSRCQKKIIEFLKFKYPRNSKDFVPTELEEIFLSVDDSEHTDNDILINAGINFDSEKIRDYERREVTKQIKLLINSMLRETNRAFDFFRLKMEGLFQGVEGSFKIGRKLSENISPYSEFESDSLEIYSPQIFRVIIKWISSLDGVFLNTQDVLKKKKYLKILEQEEEEFNYFPLYTGKTPIISSLVSALEPSSKEYLKQQQEQQQNLANFNDTVAKILTKKTDIPEINQNEIKTIKYAKYISKFVEFLATENLIYLITSLVSLREQMDKKNRKAVDLVTCDVNDLLRCQFLGSKNSILEVFQKLRGLEKEGIIKITRIKNRFATPLNDTLINFKFVGANESFIICEIQLILKKTGSAVNPKFSAFEKVNHVLYELERSIFGPMAEMSLLLTHNDTRMGYEKKIMLERSCLDSMRCPEGEILSCEHDLPIPYVCSLCSSFHHVNENSFPIHRCLNCNFYACPLCLFEFDPQYSEECYFKEIYSLMKEQFMPDLDDHEDYGFFFFNRNYLKTSQIERSGKNFFDCLQEKMNEIEEQFVFIVRFQAGKSYFHLYTTQSGELLPCFYDFLPRFDRKNFKTQRFGPYDIILFLDPSCAVQTKPSKEAHLVPIFLTKEDIPMKKVRELCYFRWQNNFYLIDVGEQLRDNDSTTSTVQAASSKQDKASELEKMLQSYRERDGELVLDYLDIRNLKLKEGIKNVRFAKLKSNRLPDLEQILKFTTLEEVDASRNEIIKVKLTKKYPTLRILDLSENYIQILEGFTDECLPLAKELNLSCNMIVNLPKIQLSKLLWLNLTNNQLKNIEQLAASVLPKLRKLSISENSIETVPNVRLEELQEIEANDNSITDMSFLTYFPKIEQVNLENNKITSIPKMNLQQLQNLLLFQNQICDLGALADSALPRLKMLDLSKNKIKQFPVLKFEELLQLDLSFNQIENIGNFEHCKNLYVIKKINLSNNKIQRLGIMDLDTLEVFNICNNKIQDLSQIVHSKIPALKEFNASFNSLTSLADFDLPQLHKFSLQSNHIDSMEHFRTANLPKLFSLNLAQNKVTKFVSADFPSLEEFFIDHNELVDISEVKEEHMRRLKVLDMSYNKITELPSMHLQSLEKLYLQQNQIQVVERFKESTFPKIIHLDLRFNNMKIFPQMKLNTLKTLALDSNEISDMGGLVNSQLASLEELKLPNNKIKSIKSLKLMKLSVLNLERNQLETIDDLADFQTPEISEIKLTKNNITNICPLKSSSLSELDLSFNNIKDITAFITTSDLPKLLTLRFNSNAIEGELPALNFPSLKSIDVAKNNISRVQKFGRESQAPKLDSIKANNNKIQNLPEFKFPKLKDLDLSNNLVRDLDRFSDSEIPKIFRLKLQNNQISALPKFEWKTLNFMSLESNKISDLSEFALSNLPSLDKLHLRNNKITEWPANIYLDKLTKLGLSENLLTNFKSINSDTVPELKELLLKKNKIEELHELKLPSLTLLNLDNNPVVESEKMVREGLKINQDARVNKNLKLTLNKKISGRESHKEDEEVLKLKERISALE